MQIEIRQSEDISNFNLLAALGSAGLGAVIIIFTPAFRRK
jgi:hypothetical protein